MKYVLLLSLLSLSCILSLACGTRPASPSELTASAATLRGCDPDLGCPGPGGPGEDTPPSATLSVVIINSSSVPRTFNAGWGLNTSQDPHPTGWLIPDEVLAPGEVRRFTGAISAQAGDEVVVGVSAYSLTTSGSWARAEPRFVLSAGSLTCTFTYTSPSGTGAMAVVCSPG